MDDVYLLLTAKIVVLSVVLEEFVAASCRRNEDAIGTAEAMGEALRATLLSEATKAADPTAALRIEIEASRFFDAVVRRLQAQPET